jgi:hypothetical protein
MFKFNTVKSAISFCDRASRSMQIVMGDDGLFWVCTLGKASILEKQGYEILSV